VSAINKQINKQIKNKNIGQSLGYRIAKFYMKSGARGS